MTMSDDTMGYEELIQKLENVYGKEVPFLMIDVKGIQKRDIVPDILKRMKMKRELWLMTGIRDPGDVMDAFNGDINKAVVPYHLTSDEYLKEMIELSDSCIPALFSDSGTVLENRRTSDKRTASEKGMSQTKNKRNDLRDVVRALERMNFRKILAFDVSGSDPVRTWEGISDLSDVVIPYVPSGGMNDIEAVHRLGFADVTVPAVRIIHGRL